jgi:hypothetical protein
MPMPSSIRRVLMERANPVASFQVEADRPLEIRPVERTSLWFLVRHLFSCFFSSELPHSVFGPATLAMQLAASLGVPPALMVLCLIASYNGTMPWGIPRTPWLQAQDHFVLITYACTVIGMVAVLTWERFLPTLPEARVLGFIPIRRGRLFLGKALAMALFFGAFLVGSSLPAAFVIVGVANSHQAARHLATHLLAVGLAGYFTATSCLALLSLTALPPVAARRIAGPLLQAGLIAFLLLSLFFSPTLVPSLQTLVTSQSRLLLWMPAFWFTGVYEFVLHTSPVGGAFAHLAAIAVAGTLISSAAFLLLYPLAYRNRASSLIEGEEARPARAGRVISGFPVLLTQYLPLPRQRASFHFLGQTLLRVQRFRASAIFASCAGCALALTIMAKLRVMTVAPYLRVSSQFPVSTVVAFLFVAVGSLRLLLSSNLEPKANWLFECIVGRWDRGVASGVRRWMFLVTCPVGIGAFAALVYLLLRDAAGFAPAPLARELITLLAACFLLVELFFHAFREIPFASSGLRRRSMSIAALVYIFAIFPLSMVVIRRLEASAAESWLIVAFLLSCAGLAYTTLDRMREQGEHFVPADDTEEEYFQRLGL